jgi:REP element-mobilizing transposase RayT
MLPPSAIACLIFGCSTAIQRKPWDYAPARNRPLSAEVYSNEGRATLFTLRCYRDRPFHGKPALCDAVVKLLVEMRVEYRCWVGAYCLMPDHLHFVAGPVEHGAPLLTFVERFKGRTTNESWKHDVSGRLWQRRFHDHVVREAEGLEAIYDYVLNNPVNAGLVGEREDWRWCGIVDHHETPYPLHERLSARCGGSIVQRSGINGNRFQPSPEGQRA